MRDFTRPLRVTDDVYWVGVNDRRKVRFENMWPIPEELEKMDELAASMAKAVDEFMTSQRGS